MNNPKISVIIPVYNGSDYIKECLDSIVNQTLREIEIICVNDGSTDNSLSILKDNAFKDDRIKIIDKENEGQGYARKVGLDNATGTYIMFCDQDDKFSSTDSFQIAFDRIEKYNTDIAIFKFAYWDEKNAIEVNKGYLPYKDIFKHNDEKTLLLTYFAPWLKIYRKKFLDTYNDWYFPKLVLIEDPPLHVQILLRAKSITYIDKILYFHRTTNPNSITKGKQYTNKHAEAFCNFAEIIKNILVKEEIFEEYKSYFFDFISVGTYNYVINSNYDVEVIKTFCNKNLNFIKSTFNIENNLDKERTLVFYFSYWGFGGTERVLSILLPHLSKKYNIILVTKNETGYELSKNIIHLKINLNNENNIIKKILTICLAFSADIFCAQPNIYGYVLKFYHVMRQAGIKTIACNHENYFRPYDSREFYCITPYRNQELKNANVVTWLTNYFNSLYLCENNNGIVMPNPLTFDVKTTSHVLNNKIICVGDFLCKIKRIDLIIEIFAKILKRQSNIELYIAGNYNSNELDILLKKFEIPSNNIHLVGKIKDVSKYYEDCSLLLMASETEGWGMVLTEAGSFGIPVVMLNINGLEDIIVNGKNGFILDRNDLDGMADRVVSTLRDKEFYDFMSQNSLDMAKRFSVDKIIDRWDNLIQCVLNTEKQDDLNKLLRDKFSLQNSEKNIYINTLIRQYENSFSKAVINYENKIQNKDSIIKTKNEQLQHKNEAIAKRDNWIKDKNEQIKNKNEQLQQKNEQIKNRDSVINQKNSEIQNLRTQNNDLHIQNNIQDQVIKRLQNSWSYRIGRIFTYPLSIPLEFYKYIRDYNLIKKSNLFDSEYYLANNEDVKKAKMNPIKHYLKFGWKEGRKPSADFNGNEYLNKRPDVRVAGICPLVHYLKFERKEDYGKI